MSAPPPTGPGPMDEVSKKELNSAILWAVLSAAFAVGMFVYAGKVDPEKKNFYLLAGGIGAVVAAVNGYSAWNLFQKGKK